MLVVADLLAPFKEVIKLDVPVGAVAPIKGSGSLMVAKGTGARSRQSSKD